MLYAQHSDSESKRVAAGKPVHLPGEMRDAREEGGDSRRGGERRVHVHAEKSQRNIRQGP